MTQSQMLILFDSPPFDVNFIGARLLLHSQSPTPALLKLDSDGKKMVQVLKTLRHAKSRGNGEGCFGAPSVQTTGPSYNTTVVDTLKC